LSPDSSDVHRRWGKEKEGRKGGNKRDSEDHQAVRGLLPADSEKKSEKALRGGKTEKGLSLGNR